MNVIQTIQGSPEWLRLRQSYHTASEAPAALGKSKYQTRSDLLKQKATGMTDDVDGAKQALFNRGHQSEADARPFAELIVKTELYPVTATLTIDGLDLLASLDGATMMEDEIFEHKLYSKSLAADVRAGTLEPHYTIQMDQQLLVSGAKRCLFMTSDGTEENMAWCWYESSQAKFDALIAGWKQFDADLAVYVPQAPTVQAVAVPQFGLPAVSIQVNGSIALIDNLQAFGEALTSYVGKINLKPETDQDFADLEATVKTLKDAENALDAAESGALAQTESIDTMRRTVSMYRDTARTNRLLVDKLVKVEKENRRMAIVRDATTALSVHVKTLDTRIGDTIMPQIVGDFVGAVKGLKSIDSMRDKVNTELARCKIEANAVADKITANLKSINEQEGFGFLFYDHRQLALKEPEFVEMVIKNRIADHHVKEAAKEEATRERIRAEEVARLAREANIKAEQDRLERLRIAQELEAAAQARNAAEKAISNAQNTALSHVEPAQTAIETVAVEVCDSVQVVDSGKQVAVMPTEYLRLGQICERLGFNITSDFLASIGFPPCATDKNAKLYHPKYFNAICGAVIHHVKNVQFAYALQNVSVK